MQSHCIFKGSRQPEVRAAILWSSSFKRQEENDLKNEHKDLKNESECMKSYIYVNCGLIYEVMAIIEVNPVY